jgi:tetratricopeptide (TPR) repeat protein/transglutaminase-like putative cysteine protease
LFGVSISLVLAQDKGQDKGSEKYLTVPSDFSKEAYVIERVAIRVAAEADGTATREVSGEVRVLADAGVKAFAVLNFIYTSDNEAVEIDYVRVHKPDGTIVKTPDYNIQDMPGEVTRRAPLYSDIHEKHVAVKGLGVGDVLECQVRYRVVKPQVPGHFWEEYSFTKKAIARDERLEISFPSGKYVKVVSPGFEPEVKEESGRKVYRWSHSNLIVSEKDPAEMPRRIPPNPDVRVTTFGSWDEIGRWYGELQKEPLQVTASVQAKANELTRGLNTDDEKIRAIYSFVALKFHYIGLDFGIGRFQPHAADDVLENGYGDCKDKHTLLASLLKAVGIEVWPVLIHSTRKLDPDVPSPAQFNHVITVVPQGDKFVWLDTTPEVSPYGLLLLTLRGKQALVIPANKAPVLMRTPENTPFPQVQSFSMEGKLNAEGTFNGHAEQSYRGDTEVALRIVFRQVPQSQWKEALQRFSYGLNFGGDVSNVNLTAPEDLSNAFDLSYDYERKNYGGWESHQITSPLPPMGVEMSKDSKKPLESVVLGGLGEIVYRGKVTLPAGYSATAPANVDLVRDYAEYHSAYSIENGVFFATRRFVIKKNEVALSGWEDFRDFGKAISDDENNFVHLTGTGAGKEKGAKEDGKKDPLSAGTEEMFDRSGGAVDDMFKEGTYALQRRDFQRAQELFEKVVAKDASYKGAHLNLGLALAARNDLPDALDEFRKEEKISPEDSRLYQVVANILTQTGRRDEAIAEWRKLLSIDPGNRTAVSTLASLLYRSEKYSEAVQVLETALKAAPDSVGLQFQLGDAYLKTKQNEKALANFRQAVEQKGDEPEILNNVAYTLADNNLNLDLARQYAEKAVTRLDEQAQRAGTSRDEGMRVTYELSLVWDTLGWIYFKQGDVRRAESLVRAAWLLGEESIVAEHLGEIYEKEGKTQQAAHAYEWALAVSSVPVSTFGLQVDAAKIYRNRADAIRARYKKLTGKEPGLTEIRRLPNGEWTKTPAEQLRQTRELKLGNEAKLSGSAEFVVVLKPGKVESAEYLSGSNDLDKLSGQMKAARYLLEFPPDSKAILVMRVNVKCQASAACIVSLVNPVPAPQFPGIVN